MTAREPWQVRATYSIVPDFVAGRYRVLDGGGRLVRSGLTHRQAWAEVQRQHAHAFGWKRRPYPGAPA